MSKIILTTSIIAIMILLPNITLAKNYTIIINNHLNHTVHLSKPPAYLYGSWEIEPPDNISPKASAEAIPKTYLITTERNDFIYYIDKGKVRSSCTFKYLNGEINKSYCYGEMLTASTTKLGYYITIDISEHTK